MLFLALLLPSANVLAQPAREAVAQVQTRVVSLVNEARSTPLSMAARLGMDPEAVLSDLPRMESVLRNGLPPLTPNHVVSAAAQGHVADMIERKYYGSESPEGRGPLDRLREAGYPAYFAGESLGLLTFLNFLDPIVAAERMFQNMFRDELRPDRREPRYILSEKVADIGVGFDSGQMEVSGKTFNSYLMAVDFGNRLNADFRGESVRRSLLQLVNQARRDPLSAAASLGLEAADLIHGDPRLPEIPRRGLAPWNIQSSLQTVAKERVREMVLNGTVSAPSSGKPAPQEKLIQTGYPSDAWVKERVRLIPAHDAEGFADVARRMYQGFLGGELDGMESNDLFVFHPDLKEVGLSVGSLVLFREGMGYQPYFVGVMLAGSGGVDHRPHILLNLYLDQDADGKYSSGEGIPEFGFDVWGYDTGVYPPTEIPKGLLVTDPVGGLQIPAFPGVFILRTNFGRGVEKWVLNVAEENIALPIRLGGPSEAR